MDWMTVGGDWGEIKSCYQEIKPVLKKYHLKKSERTIAFQIICCRQFDKKLTWWQDDFDKDTLLRKCHIDTQLYIPPKYRRDPMEQPD